MILTYPFLNYYSNPDPLGQIGQCVKASLEQNVAVWKVSSCLDATSKGYVCQKRQTFDEIGEKLERKYTTLKKTNL